VPGASARLAEQMTHLVQSLRRQELYKVPGVSETIDWVTALVALDRQALDSDAINETLGLVLKTKEDLESVRGQTLNNLVGLAMAQA
jgi:MoxR-like ATPase